MKPWNEKLFEKYGSKYDQEVFTQGTLGAAFLLISCIEDNTVFKPTPPHVNKAFDAYKDSVPDYPGGIAFKVLYGNKACFASVGLGPKVGAHEGFLSYMIYDPEMDLTMVAFTNVWNLKGGSSTMY